MVGAVTVADRPAAPADEDMLQAVRAGSIRAAVIATLTRVLVPCLLGSSSTKAGAGGAMSFCPSGEKGGPGTPGLPPLMIPGIAPAAGVAITPEYRTPADAEESRGRVRPGRDAGGMIAISDCAQSISHRE